MQRIYFILAAIGWVWLIVAGLALALILWREKRSNAATGLEAGSGATADGGEQ